MHSSTTVAAPQAQIRPASKRCMQELLKYGCNVASMAASKPLILLMQVSWSFWDITASSPTKGATQQEHLPKQEAVRGRHGAGLFMPTPQAEV